MKRTKYKNGVVKMNELDLEKAMVDNISMSRKLETVDIVYDAQHTYVVQYSIAQYLASAGKQDLAKEFMTKVKRLSGFTITKSDALKINFHYERKYLASLFAGLQRKYINSLKLITIDDAVKIINKVETANGADTRRLNSLASELKKTAAEIGDRQAKGQYREVEMNAKKPTKTAKNKSGKDTSKKAKKAKKIPKSGELVELKNELDSMKQQHNRDTLKLKETNRLDDQWSRDFNKVAKELNEALDNVKALKAQIATLTADNAGLQDDIEALRENAQRSKGFVGAFKSWFAGNKD